MGYYSPPCVENALEMLELSETGNKIVRRNSLGMKQCFGLARAVLTREKRCYSSMMLFKCDVFQLRL